MTNKEIYEIMSKLQMVDDADTQLIHPVAERDFRTGAERFQEDVCTDLISVINFVDELTTFNDLNTLKKFLIVLLYDKTSRNIDVLNK